MNALRISRQDLDDSSQQNDFEQHQQIVFRKPLQQTTNIYNQQREIQEHQALKLKKGSNRFQRPDFVQNNQAADIENTSEFFSQQIDSHQVINSHLCKNLYYQPQIIDQDVEDFTRRLDMSIMTFRSQSLKDFMKIKRHLLKEQAERIHAEKSKCDAMLSAKQNQIEQLREELAHAYKQIQSFDIKTNSLSAMTGKIKRDKRQISAIMNLIQRWRSWALRKKGNRFRVQNFAPRKKHLDQKIVFISWARYYRKNQSRIQTQQWENKLKNRVGQVTMKYSKQIDSLKALLDETQKKLELQQRKSLNVIDNLKKSMMRGMCAINFEAMNILDPNQQNESLLRSLANQQIQQPQKQHVPFMPNNSLSQQQYTQNSLISPLGNSSSQFDILAMKGINSTPQRSLANQSNITTPNLQQKKGQEQLQTFRTEPSTQIPPSAQGGFYPEKQPTQLPQTIQGSLKIESKDHRWQPAPIFGKAFTGTKMSPSGTFGKDQNTPALQTIENIKQTQPIVNNHDYFQQQYNLPLQSNDSNVFMSDNYFFQNKQANAASNMLTSHTVDQLLEMRRPKTSAAQIMAQQPIKSNAYTPVIQADNAINSIQSFGIANQLPTVGINNQKDPVQSSSGKTIRINTKGKSYLSQEKKVNTKSTMLQQQQRPSSLRGTKKSIIPKK